MDDDLHTEFRLTIFREGNKTAKHIPDMLDFKTMKALNEQVASNKLDADTLQTIMAGPIRVENEDGERIVIPRSEFVGYKVGKVLA